MKSTGNGNNAERNIASSPENAAETSGGFKVFLALCAIAIFWTWKRKRKRKLSGLNTVEPKLAATVSLRTEPIMKKNKAKTNYNDELVMIIDPSDRHNSAPAIPPPSALDQHNLRVNEWANKNVLKRTSSEVQSKSFLNAGNIVSRDANWLQSGTERCR